MKLDLALQLKVGGIALSCIGAAMAIISGLSYLEANAAARWPAADARVVRSEIQVTKKVGGIRRGQAVQTDYYTAAIRYEYAVNGRTYTGTRICLDDGDTSGYERSDAERWVRQYPTGASIRIHYAPDQPQRSVIDRTPNGGFLALLFFLGKLAILGGIALARYGMQMEPVAVEPEPVAVPAVVEQAVPSRQPARATHWAISTIAVLAGLMFFLLGSLCLPVGVKQYVQAMSSEDVNHAVHIIVIAIMGGMMLFGAFLVWFPLRRRPALPLSAA